MPKIKNMGSSTMKFNEGIIISGSASQPDGSYSDYGLVVTGSQFIDAQGGGKGLTIFKEEADSSFIRFINSDDPSSWYAFIAMDSAENLYIFPGRSQDFNVRSRTNTGSDPIKFPFRIYDNGKAKFEHGQISNSDAAADLPEDVVFFVSGSLDRQNNVLFGGDVITSGSMVINNSLSSPPDTINHTTFNVMGGVEGVSLIRGTSAVSNNEHKVMVLYGGQTQTPDANMFTDMNFFVSGSSGSKGTANKGTSVFGGDVVVSGSFYGSYRQTTYNKFNRGDSNEFFPRFNSNGSNTSAGENNIFLAPANGKLKYAMLRTRLAAGNTTVSLHKANTGTTIANTGFDSVLETISVSSLAAETSYKFTFTDNASFNEGDVLGISINPTNNGDNGNITCVWEFDFTD